VFERFNESREHPRLLVATPLRLALLAVAALLVLLALLIGWTFAETNTVLARQVARTVAADTTALSEEFERTGRSGLLAQMEERRLADPDAIFLLLARRGGPQIGGNIAYVASEHDRAGDGYVFRYTRRSNGPERLAASTQRTLPDGSVLIVGRDIDEQRAHIERVRLVLLGGMVAVALVGLGSGLLLSRHILRRIDGMASASRAIMAGNLSGRIPQQHTGDELDRLAGSLNTMLERIERLMIGLREVSDNIAHDLKTPLNRLRNRAEAALRDDRGSPAWRDGLERTIEEADDLIKTFNALLLIAKLEAGAVEETLEPMDLAEVVADVAELYAPAAEDAGFRLEHTAVPPIPVHANRQLVGQALTNLIDNALKYSAKQAQTDTVPPAITITAIARDGKAILTVADRGPGIAAADRERALKRFVRLEISRSRPGTGLGLSLVTAVAQMHGGTVRLEDNEPGLRAVLELPLDPTPRPTAPDKPSAPAGVKVEA
jgi:signal transduction histidine kinase